MKYRLCLGYHGDDGNVFCGDASGRSFGPRLRVGDVFGCGINYRTQELFFTLNGGYLGPAAYNIPIHDWFFTISFAERGYCIDVIAKQNLFDINKLLSSGDTIQRVSCIIYLFF